MLLDRRWPHAFRQRMVAPAQADTAVKDAVASAERRAARGAGLQAYAVHLSHDRTRVVTVEAWRDEGAYSRDEDALSPGSALYTWAATGGIEPTPVDDPGAGVIVIDIVPVWRPLLRPVAAFTIRNGEAFNHEPGCMSTTVLRGLTAGMIATYARWRSVDDFAAAFSKLTGRRAANCKEVNAAAAKMTFGLIRPDYHSYELVAFKGDAR